MPSLRAATCTPVDFVADDHFFGRDTGLINRSLQAIGVESVSIMPGTRHPDEPDDLIRATPAQLADVSWWRALKLDFVVLYAWGDPNYLDIAKAIRGAGIFLIQNLDTAGIDSPYADIERWWTSLRDYLRGPLPLGTKARLVARGVRDLIPAIYEKKRLEMLRESDALACVSPPAMQCMAEYITALGGAQLTDKLHVIPHPVVDSIQYHGETKTNRVLCVGRWERADHHQKDPELTLAILQEFLAQAPDWQAEVIGRNAGSLSNRITASVTSVAKRIQFTDALPREELIGKYLESRIILCASRYESFHISSAEALCGGCSVVTAEHPLLGSTRWFTTRDSGTLAPRRDFPSLLHALQVEATAWDQGHRDPARIASIWQREFHAKKVAARALAILTPESR